jgi:antitoxin YefM
MLVCTYSDLREHLRERLDQVHESRAPLLVTRQNGPSAVLIDKEEFDGIMETLHLLSTPANAERLRQSIAEADAGKVTERNLVDE